MFRDDFSGPAGQGVDRGSWQYDLGTQYDDDSIEHWGTGEVTVMTDSPENVSLDGRGHLVITPLRDADGGWTSGRLETLQSDFAAPAGGALRVEGRLALPSVTGDAAKGYLSAFWLLGSTFRPSHVYDPTLGELDIMEHINGTGDPLGVLHCLPRPQPQPPTGGSDPCNEKPDNVGLAGKATCPPAGCLSGFHTYAVELHRECAPERIDWLVDGRGFFSVRQDQPGMDDETWERIVGQSFFIILNQSIGGTWPGGPTPATRPGSPLVADYVAVSVRTPKITVPAGKFPGRGGEISRGNRDHGLGRGGER